MFPTEVTQYRSEPYKEPHWRFQQTNWLFLPYVMPPIADLVSFECSSMEGSSCNEEKDMALSSDENPADSACVLGAGNEGQQAEGGSLGCIDPSERRAERSVDVKALLTSRLPFPKASTRYAEGARIINESKDSSTATNIVKSLSSVVSTKTGTPRSTTSAFLLGVLNDPAELEGIDLPKFVQENQSTLTFPEKLMLLLTHVEGRHNKSSMKKKPCMAWTPNGKAFVIHNQEELVQSMLPSFFPKAKFASFTRKLYRWGFRQLSNNYEGRHGVSARGEKPLWFGHECFQRDNKTLMTRMRSVTAAGTRRALASIAVKQRQRMLESQAERHEVPLSFGGEGTCDGDASSQDKSRGWSDLPSGHGRVEHLNFQPPVLQAPPQVPFNLPAPAPAASFVPMSTSFPPSTVPASCGVPQPQQIPSALPNPFNANVAFATFLVTAAAHVAAAVHQQMVSASLNPPFQGAPPATAAVPAQVAPVYTAEPTSEPKTCSSPGSVQQPDLPTAVSIQSSTSRCQMEVGERFANSTAASNGSSVSGHQQTDSPPSSLPTPNLGPESPLQVNQGNTLGDNGVV